MREASLFGTSMLARIPSRGVWAALMICSLLGLGAAPATAQIRGSEEVAPFEPGDLVLWEEDDTSFPLGAQAPGWEVLTGSYEVAEFEGRRWLRPLAAATQLTRRVEFPEDFSLEFQTYLFSEAGPRLKLHLVTRKDLDYPHGFGPDGPAQLTVWVSRGYHPDHDTVRAWVRDPERRGMLEFVRDGSYKFPPSQVHHIALSVRNGKLQLYFDGKRVGIAPFDPEAPIAGLSLVFDSGGGHEKPYRDRPALFGNVRLAAYTSEAAPRYAGVHLYLVAPPASAEERNQPQGTRSSVLDELEERFGWQEANPIQFRASRGSARGSVLLTSLLRVPLPAAPFEQGDTSARMGQAGEAFIASLGEALEVVRREVPDGGLLIRGQVLRGEGATERERALLRRLRALAFAAWLARQGIGDPDSLISIVADNGGYAGILLRAGSGQYEGILE